MASKVTVKFIETLDKAPSQPCVRNRTDDGVLHRNTRCIYRRFADGAQQNATRGMRMRPQQYRQGNL